MTYLREFPGLISVHLLALAVDNADTGSGIVNRGIEINGGKAQVSTVCDPGRHDLDHWITDPLGLVVLPD